MSKTQKAIALNPKAVFTVTKGKNGETFAITPKYKAELIAAGSEVGGFLQTAEQKVAIALNLATAFGEYKRITNNGLPAFVHDMLDATCPKSYGKVGSDDRKALTTHKLFNGIEYLYKKGSAALVKMNERKALSDAGIDVDNQDEVNEHNKEAREQKAEAFRKSFERVIVGFYNFGVTETTISNLLILMGKHEKDDKVELNKAGVVLRDAAVKAVFTASAKNTRNVTPQADTTTTTKKK